MIAERVAAGLLREFGEAPPVRCDVDWAGPVEMALRDEESVQAACGIMHVHGRAFGAPRLLGVHYASTVAGVLAAQGTLAAELGKLRGARIDAVRTSVTQAALLAVGQYLAVATSDDDWDERWEPGARPPFRSQDGVRFELETLRPEAWRSFWTRIGADAADVAAGWWPFQQRFATASCALPEALLSRTRRHAFRDLLREAAQAEVSLLPVREDPAQPEVVPACTFRELPGSARASRWESGAPLAGIVVVESTRRIQGPMAGHVLWMLGADVVRVEPPGGDPMRGVPPLSGAASARFRVLNDDKRVAEIDLKTTAGQQELRDLVAGADAFVHNWAPGRAERCGLDADDLARVRPGLVHAWSSGWAPLPWPDPPLGTDYLVQAHSGLAAAVGPERAPSLMTLTDIMGGLVCAAGVLAALLHRERTGSGRRVDSSLYSAAGVIPRTPTRLDRLLRREGRFVLPDGTPVCADLRELAADPRFKRALNHAEHASPRPPWEFG